MEKETNNNFIRCEGYERHGGAFTFGPVVWRQCENEAVVMLSIIQDHKKLTLPSCISCWKKCIEKGLVIRKVVPL